MSASSAARLFLAAMFMVIGVLLAAAGFYVGHTDDAPGAALLGILLMIGALTVSVRMLRRRT